MSKYKRTVIPNHNPNLVLAEPSYEGESIDGIYTMPIVAWNIEYDTETDGRDRPFSFVNPVTIESLPSLWVIADKDSEEWYDPENRTGKGEDMLIKHFQEMKK